MKIPSLSINGNFYHGTTTVKGDDPFIHFDFCGDFDGIWFADNEETATEFAECFGTEDRTVIIYSVKIKTSRIANIDGRLATELMEYYCVNDLREVIPFLKGKGFKGWKTIGGINGQLYNDYCLFDKYLPHIKEVKKIENCVPSLTQ